MQISTTYSGQSIEKQLSERPGQWRKAGRFWLETDTLKKGMVKQFPNFYAFRLESAGIAMAKPLKKTHSLSFLKT